MSNWTDFNDAEQQKSSYDIIPKGTIAKVRMMIRPGGYDDPAQGWTGGWATQSQTTGSVYLDCVFVVTEGQYAKRKIWGKIGLYSPKGPTWANMGRSLIRAILNSARGVHPQDNSPQAAAARRIDSFADLDGLEFVARIDIEQPNQGEPRNVIRAAIEPGHPDYARIMGAQQTATATTTQPAPTTQQRLSKPAWAQ